jgi:hypothetical protein
MDGGEMAAELDGFDPAQLMHDAFHGLRPERPCAEAQRAEAKRTGTGHEAAAVELKEGCGGL